MTTDSDAKKKGAALRKYRWERKDWKGREAWKRMEELAYLMNEERIKIYKVSDLTPAQRRRYASLLDKE